MGLGVANSFFDAGNTFFPSHKNAKPKKLDYLLTSVDWMRGNLINAKVLAAEGFLLAEVSLPEGVGSLAVGVLLSF